MLPVRSAGGWVRRALLGVLLAVAASMVVAAPPAGAVTTNALLVPRFGMFGNWRQPDCLLAASAEFVQIDRALRHESSNVRVLSAQVARDWRALGAPPGGLHSEEVFYWLWHGHHALGGLQLTGAAPIVRTRRNIKSAIEDFGGVIAVMELPPSILRHDRDPAIPWRGGTGGPPIRHAAVIAGWTGGGVTIVSWGEVFHASWAWLLGHMPKAWAVSFSPTGGR